MRESEAEFSLPTAFTLLSVGYSEVDRDAAVNVAKAFTETGILVDCRPLLLRSKPGVASMVSQHQKITELLMKRSYTTLGNLDFLFKHGDVAQL